MKPITNFLIAAVLLLHCFSAINAQHVSQSRVNGNWTGKIKTPLTELGVVFKIKTEPDGTLSAKMDVPQQGAKDIATNSVKSTGDSLFIGVSVLNGTFKGAYTSDSTLEGTWKQGMAVIPLLLKKITVDLVLHRPQTPGKPFSYIEEQITYTNPVSGLKLAGTLTFPQNFKKAPAVILVTGSGAQDRDETIFEHRPFLVISDFLTRRGIAVLRVDDRGVGGSEGKITDATSADFASDVKAGIAYLISRKEIDKNKIGLLGHSEGGIIAPIVASESKNIIFIILLAGPGMNGEQILYEQNSLTLKAAGLNEDAIKQNEQVQRAIFDILRNEKDTLKKLDRLQRTYTGGVYPMMNAEQKKNVDSQVKSVDNVWFRYFLNHDPIPVLQKVKCPVLALNGEKDVQVAPDSNLAAIEKALKEAGNKNFKTIRLKNLNHLFQNCTTGAISEYGEIEETISPEVLEIVGSWISEVVK